MLLETRVSPEQWVNRELRLNESDVRVVFGSACTPHKTNEIGRLVASSCFVVL